jgi:hypothetical protein
MSPLLGVTQRSLGASPPRSMRLAQAVDSVAQRDATSHACHGQTSSFVTRITLSLSGNDRRSPKL